MSKKIDLNFEEVFKKGGSEINNLPSKEGSFIYVLKRGGSVEYIGQTNNIKKRMSQHHSFSLRGDDELCVADVDGRSINNVEEILIYENRNKPLLNDNCISEKPSSYDDYEINVSGCPGLKGKK